MPYWLMKTEPSCFSIDDLEKKQVEHWDGVRNYQVRNFIRDEMKLKDQTFIYHSSCAEPGIVGIAEISTKAYPDFTAFDSHHEHYDPKSDPANPRWWMVDVKFVRKFTVTLTLGMLREREDLHDLIILRRGNRLSITPITPAQWRIILAMTR